ncbi:MAG: T9SS type A sorting domain-containing protein [Flavobacteriales bacterium]|nr:T9SS type A sorting domain-containing protein [Flavobacteriales bacterium]
MKNLLLLLSFAILSTPLVAQTSYTWNGTTNTAWGTSTNWTPNGVPSSSDYIVIQSASHNLKLTSDKTIERYRINSGTMNLDGYTLTVNDQLLMYGGTTTSGKIVQSATNSTTITNATVNCKLDLTATTVTVQYASCTDSVKIHQTTGSGSTWWRGNKFYGHVDVENTSNANMNMGNNPADSCFAGLTISGRRIRLAYQYPYNYVQGDVVINDEGPSGTSFGLAGGNGSAKMTVDGNIILNKSGLGDLNMAVTSGTCELIQTSGNGVIDGSTGYTDGFLKIMGLTQQGTGGGVILNKGADAQEFYLQQGTYGPNIGSLTIDLDDVTVDGAVINGAAYVTGGNILITDNRFLDNVALTKESTGTDTVAGNVFMSDLVITNDATGPIRVSAGITDSIYGGLLVTSTHNNVVLGYSMRTVVHGDVTCDEQGGNVVIGNGTSTGRLVFAGSGQQNLSLGGDNIVETRRLEIDKPSGRVLLMDDITITKGLYLTNGIIECRSNALVSLDDGIVLPTATDNSYVEGAVKKIGNDAFTFPVGRNGIYRPISITAPSTVTDAFTGEYFESNSDWINSHASKASSLDYLSTNEYWTLTRNVGSSTPVVKLSWDTVTSCVMDPSLSARHVAGWNGTQWDDLGNGATTGTADKGTISTSSGVSDFNMFVLESDSSMECGCELPKYTIGPSDTCISNIPMDNNELWLTLIPDSSSIDLDIWLASDNDFGVIDSILLYEGCGSAPIFTKGIDTVFEYFHFKLELDSLVALSDYKLRFLRKDTVTDHNYYRVCIQQRGPRAECADFPDCDLIGNGGLENYIPTASTTSQICVNLGPTPLCNWFTAGGSPDMQSAFCDGYNPLLPNELGWYGIDPSNNPNGGGILDNLSGQGNEQYLSIVTYRYKTQPGFGQANRSPNWREYIGTKLKEPLEAGTCYYYSYDAVCRSNNSRQSRWMTNGMGIAFSIGQIPPIYSLNVSNGLIVPGFYPETHAIVATNPNNIGTTWETMDGVITPTVGGQDIVTLGNFNSDAQVLNGNPFPALSNGNWNNQAANYFNGVYARYHLDNIRVVKMALLQDDMEVCAGTTLELGVGCSSIDGFSFEWEFSGDPDFGITVGDVGQVVIDPFIPDQHAGTYTVHITAPDGTECEDQVVVSQTAPDNSLGITGCEYTCEYSMPCTLSVELPVGYTNLQWGVPGGGTNPIVWTGQGTEQIIVSDWGDYYGEDVIIFVTANNGVKEVCNFIELKGCCIAYEDDGTTELHRVVDLSVSDFNATTVAPVVNTSGATWTISEDFTVTGTMTVDHDLALEGCEVTLTQGATIEVLSPFTLTITDNGTTKNSWLHACGDYLWHKLIVWEGGNLTVESNASFSPSTTIEDAYFGTLFRGNGALDIRNSNYDRNYFHVFIRDKSDITSAILSNNDFTCTSQLNTNGDDLRETLVGLFIENSSVSSGTDMSWPGTANDNLVGNHFANAKWGIRGENSNVALYEYNLFEYIRKADSYGGWENAGWGVQCFAPSGSDRKFEAFKNNIFRDSDCGIFTWGMNDVHVETSASFTRLNGGVSSTGASSAFDGIGVLTHASTGNVLINGCTFTDCEWGIQSRFNNLDATEWVRLSSNTIMHTMSYDPYTIGIGVIGFGANDNSNMLVGKKGILGQPNTIQSMATGIFTWNLANPIVAENNISVSSGFGNGSVGVSAINCPRAEIVKNTIVGGGSGNYRGIQSQTSPFADIRCNDISYTNDAIYNYGGMPGALIEENTMATSTNGYVHKNGFINNQGSPTVPSNNLWVNHDSFTRHTYNIDPTVTPGDFYVQGSPNTDFYPDPFISIAVNPSLSLYKIEVQSSTGTSSSTDCDSVPEYRSPDPTLAKAIALDTLVFHGVDSLEARQWARLHVYRALRYDSIYTMDSTFQAFVDTMNLTAYRDLDSIAGQLTFPLDSATEKHLLDVNAKVVATDTLQSLFKTVLGIGVDHYFSNDSSWTGSDISYLREVAALCPLKYGPGVYQARSLLLSMDTTIVFYENVCELPVEPSAKRAAPEPDPQHDAYVGTLKLYPNPTTGIVTIECHLQEDDRAELMVYEMTGRRVYSNTRVCGSDALQLNGLSEGLYHCVLIINGKAALTEKLVILKQ